jgi:hypothetical protein
MMMPFPELWLWILEYSFISDSIGCISELACSLFQQADLVSSYMRLKARCHFCRWSEVKILNFAQYSWTNIWGISPGRRDSKVRHNFIVFVLSVL